MEERKTGNNYYELDLKQIKQRKGTYITRLTIASTEKKS